MDNDKFSLGIDTSNYRTSVAVVSKGGEILFSSQSLLDVKDGQRGLRQSEAFFQHVNKLPDAIAEALISNKIRKKIGCIAVSDRPRPVSGSYMPVFNAGVSAAKVLSAALNIPLYCFSHQEGHVEAVRHYTPMKDEKRFIFFHFSGGTTEAVLVDEEKNIFEIVGGSKDISYGQVIDRIGVSMGIKFPCGNIMDFLAVSCKERKKLLSDIKVCDGYFNLSGIETQGQRLISSVSEYQLAESLFLNLCRSICEMTMQLADKYKTDKFIFAGGVSSSVYVRNYIKDNLGKKVRFVFGKYDLCTDNAVGTALLGGNKIWL